MDAVTDNQSNREASSSVSVIERCRRLEGQGLKSFAEGAPQLVIESAEGSWLITPEGRRVLDFAGSYAVANTGHRHPKVVEAIKMQSDRLLHCISDYVSEVRAQFYEAIESIAPHELGAFYPAMTGAMANELAVAVVRQNRPGGEIVTFSNGYFGRSMGVVGLAGHARNRQALGVSPGGHFLPYPDRLRLGPNATDMVMTFLEMLADSGGGYGKLGAVFVEPIQGSGGVIIPDNDFLPRLRSFCDRTGALLVFDEVQAGFGRTGKMWSCQHFGVTPDLMSIGKGIGGGLAAAALLGRRELMRLPPNGYSTTFLTNNLNLAASAAAIGVMLEERLDERSAELGSRYLKVLQQKLNGLPGIADVRGLGLWFAMELQDDNGQPDGVTAKSVAKELLDAGVLVGTGGYRGHIVKMAPPLNIPEADLANGIDKVVTCLETALATARRKRATAV